MARFKKYLNQKIHHFRGVKGLALPLLLVEIINNNSGLNVVLTESAHESIVLEEELELCAPELKDKIFHFPAWDTLPYDVFSPNPEIISQRLAFLYQISHKIELPKLPLSMCLHIK